MGLLVSGTWVAFWAVQSRFRSSQGFFVVTYSLFTFYFVLLLTLELFCGLIRSIVVGVLILDQIGGV